MCGSCGCGGSCWACKLIAIVVALLLTLTTIAAAIGVYNTHNVGGAWVFGTVQGSVALGAFILSLMAWHKVSKKICPCYRKGCGCGSSGCNCGDGGGVCPGCGKNPCRCK